MYAITGANGFIASHMVTRLLDEGHGVVAIVRRGARRAYVVHTRTHAAL